MSSAGDQLLQCYNVSCGVKYHEADNHDEACTYHDGKPYFHDGYKEWTCCKMRSRDFTIFMGFKGCAKGRHSNVKPPIDPKPDQDDAPNCTSPQVMNGNQNEKEAEEPKIEPFIPPNEDLRESIRIVEAASVATAPPVKSIVICKNCKAEESTIADVGSTCRYHRGVQVFHDSLKYWSCCTHKKFTEFEDFQKLPPCATADTHQLMVKIDYKENWFQTGDTLTIALYGLRGARLRGDSASGSSPSLPSTGCENISAVTLRGGRHLAARLVNRAGITIFENEWPLFGYVHAADSKVTLNSSNAQIVLKKAGGVSQHHWPSLIDKSGANQNENGNR